MRDSKYLLGGWNLQFDKYSLKWWLTVEVSHGSQSEFGCRSRQPWLTDVRSLRMSWQRKMMWKGAAGPWKDEEKQPIPNTASFLGEIETGKERTRTLNTKKCLLGKHGTPSPGLFISPLPSTGIHQWSLSRRYFCPWVEHCPGQWRDSALYDFCFEKETTALYFPKIKIWKEVCSQNSKFLLFFFLLFQYCFAIWNNFFKQRPFCRVV